MAKSRVDTTLSTRKIFRHSAQFLVFPIFTRFGITVYQHGKSFLVLNVNLQCLYAIRRTSHTSLPLAVVSCLFCFSAGVLPISRFAPISSNCYCCFLITCSQCHQIRKILLRSTQCASSSKFFFLNFLS